MISSFSYADFTSSKAGISSGVDSTGFIGSSCRLECISVLMQVERERVGRQEHFFQEKGAETADIQAPGAVLKRTTDRLVIMRARAVFPIRAEISEAGFLSDPL